MQSKLFLVAPSGKTIQAKINSLLKYYSDAKYSENDGENLLMIEAQIKNSIISLVKRSYLNKR